MKKKFKHRMTGRKRQPDGTGTNPGGEGADPTSSLPQPGSHLMVGESYDREEDKANAAGEQVFSTGRLPQPDGPESVPARGSDNDQEAWNADVDGGGGSQKHSHPRSDVKVSIGSGPREELEGAHPSPSTPSISHGGKLDST